MTLTMYDSVNVDGIPPGASMIACYDDGLYTNAAAMRARFPHAQIIEITVNAYDNRGNVLDVENGDATPAEAPGWVMRRRAAGVQAPGVYCSLDIWPDCIAAFRRQGVADPLWWIAHYDGDPTLSTGMFAKQYRNLTDYDISAVAAPWPGLTPPGGYVTTLDPQDKRDIIDGILSGIQGTAVRDALAYADLWWLDHALAGTVTPGMSDAQKTLVLSIHTSVSRLGAKPAA